MAAVLGFMPTATKGSSTGPRKGSTPSKCSLLFVASSSSLSKLTLAASIVVLTVWASTFWTHDLPLYTPEPYVSAVQMQTSWAHCDRHLDSEFCIWGLGDYTDLGDCQVSAGRSTVASPRCDGAINMPHWLTNLHHFQVKSGME